MAKAVFNKKTILFPIKSDFNFRQKQGVTVKTFKDVIEKNRTQRRS